MQRYQWLLFDADGTLFDYDRAESAALGRVFELMGVPFEPRALAAYRRINGALWPLLEKGQITPALIKVRRFELLLESLGIDYPAEKLSVSYLTCLAERSELMEDAAEVLQALQGKYRMAILTNGLTLVQRGRLARSAIRPFITEMIISEEIGFSKPAKEYFDVALARLGHPARAESLMIGDGWSSDILGASQSRIDACWYNPGRKARPSDVALTREIASLRELADWLG